MSDIKKYYYLKLKENFFDSDELKILEGMPNGVYYSNLLLKLYLKGLKFEGKLRLNDYIPYSPEMISTITNVNIDIVRTGLKVLEQLKLIEVLPDGTIYMLEIQNYIGRSSSEGDRIREYRKKIDAERFKELPESTNVVQMYDERTPEIELEKEIEKDIIPYQEIIDYLNLKASTAYRCSSKKTKDLIKVRWNEKFTLDNFKTVIDKKCNEWLGTEHEKYLRPETLFGTKFEGYLNQKVVKKTNKPSAWQLENQRSIEPGLEEKLLSLNTEEDTGEDPMEQLRKYREGK